MARTYCLERPSDESSESGGRTSGNPAANTRIDDAQKTSDEKLFVSMPLVNQVAVVNTTTWKTIANIDTGLKPTRW